MHGLNTYNYGARLYDPVTALRDRIYPIGEKYYSISPYTCCAVNPLKYIDTNKERIVIHGNRSQRIAAYPYLQILTNDKLEVKHIKKGARIK